MGISGVIDFDDEEIEAASHWYGGQGSMLYAVTSTGALKRGTIRPRHDDGTPMTDEEWIVDLAERLEGEAEDAAREAGKRARKAKGDEKKELLADKDGLRSIALKASQLVRDAKRANKPAHATKRSSKQVKKDRDQFLAELAARPKRSANVIVYSRPSGYWYAQAHDAATGARISDATDYSREGVLRALRGQYPMMGVTIESVRDHDPYETAHATKGSARMHHAIKKTATQLDREIDQAIGKRIDRKKLGEMMHPWSSLGYGSAGTAVYAVASHYDSGMKYPDRTVVERALKAIEADIPKAEHGAHGWTKADAKDLRRIAAGLRYYLLHDYGSGGNGGRAHSTRRDDDLYPTAETRRQVQTIRRREDFPEILAISMRADGTNYSVKVPDPKNPRGYDLVDVLVHHNGARSIKSASRSRTTPDRASKIVSKYLAATG